MNAKEEDARIVQCKKESFPHCRFVGKRYKNADRVNGAFGAQWGQWHGNGWFDPLEKLLTDQFKRAYPDADAYIGFQRNGFHKPDDYYEYWIGMFLPADCQVPEEYDYIDLNYDFVGVCYIQGGEDKVYMKEGKCYERIVAEGMKIAACEDGGMYFFERCQCPRFTTPDENGEIILDIGFFVE